MSRKIKTTPAKVAESPGRAPLLAALEQVRAGNASNFQAIEPIYREAMYAFDTLVAAGQTTQGDRQNGKGDFFNDVLAVLLERCSGKPLHRRGSLRGLLFANHSLDIAYPKTGTVALTVETKATGIPKHPRSEKQHPSGRPGSADLEKRIKEAAFKDIDIKGHYASTHAEPAASSDLRRWLSQTPPRNWLALSVRVRDPGDLAATVRFAQAASSWFEDCGLYAYGHIDWDLNRPYEEKQVPPALRLHGVLHNICGALQHA